MPVRRLRFAALLAVAVAWAAPAVADRATKWPTRGRYMEVMQNHAIYNRDPKLKGARIETDQRERPLAWGGSFSTVFRVITQSGRKIALRVFHPVDLVTERQSATTLSNRYLTLARYLGKLLEKGRLPPEIVQF